MNYVIVGMEPTGNYFFNLAKWLMDRDPQEVLVNPTTTKRNKEIRENNPSKSDPKDAAIIADIVGYIPRMNPETRSSSASMSSAELDTGLTPIPLFRECLHCL